MYLRFISLIRSNKVGDIALHVSAPQLCSPLEPDLVWVEANTVGPRSVINQSP